MRDKLWTLAVTTLVLAIVGCKSNESSEGTAEGSETAENQAPSGEQTEGAQEGESPEAQATPEAADNSGIPQLTDTMPSAISQNRPPANTDPDPAADYTTLAQVMADHDAAIGKTVLFRGTVGRLAPAGDVILLSECEYEGRRTMFEGSYTADQRDLVRAMPSNSAGVDCPRIHLTITGFRSGFDRPEGAIIQVYDVQPDPAPASLPDGVDFISMDDALMAGPAAVGLVVDVAVSRGPERERDGVLQQVLYTIHCGAHGGMNAGFDVAVDDSNRSLLGGVPRGELDPTGCQRLRFRLLSSPTAAFPNRFIAEVIGVGGLSEVPSPKFNP